MISDPTYQPMYTRFLAPGMTDWQPGQCLLTVKPDWVGREVKLRREQFS